MDTNLRNTYRQLIDNQVHGKDTTVLLADIIARATVDAVKNSGVSVDNYRRFEQMRSKTPAGE